MNKTNSAVQLRWNPALSAAFTDDQKKILLRKLKLNSEGEIVLRSDVHRAQDQNRSECLEKLEQLIERSLFVQKKRVKTKPTYSSKLKKQEAKKRRADVKLARRKIHVDDSD